MQNSVSNKATAIAHPNIAFIKYWGKADETLNIPSNSSISMNLSGLITKTTVDFSSLYYQDMIIINGLDVSELSAGERVKKHLDRIRTLAAFEGNAKVQSENNFASDMGIASSASAFAALSLAGSVSLGVELNMHDLSILARKGSGSASRSIHPGFVEWIAGTPRKDLTSYARQLAPPEHWDICDIVVQISTDKKLISSSLGHRAAVKSPFFNARQESLSVRLPKMRRAIFEKDFSVFGQELEQEAMSFHSIAMTSPLQLSDVWLSGIYYLAPATLALMKLVQKWRSENLEVYFTLDAGPTVHLICERRNENAVLERLEKDSNDLKIINIMKCYPANGAYTVADDLF